MSTTIDTTTDIHPFQIEIPQEQIDDLRQRIAATRWPSTELVPDRSQGVQRATLQELARYWTSGYDWRKAEAKLNALPQFTTEIDGVEIHFIHVRSPHENALPLIMTHGWPGSVMELLDTVGPLTDPTAHGGEAEDAFHLVLPSIPGYGFSAEPTEIGWDPGRIGAGLGGADEPLGLHPLRRPGRRRGCRRYRRDGPPSARGAGRHPHEPAGDGAGRPWARGNREGTRSGSRRSAPSGRPASATTWSRRRGRRRSATPCWTHPSDWRPGCSTTTRTATTRSPRAFVDGAPGGQPHAGQHPRQHHAVLADGHRRLGGAGLLGGRTSTSSRGWPGSSGGLGPGGLHHVPRRGLPSTAQLGGEGLPRSRLLQRGRQGRPLRRLGGAGALLRRSAGCIQLTALTAQGRSLPDPDGLTVGVRSRNPGALSTAGTTRPNATNSQAIRPCHEE